MVEGTAKGSTTETQRTLRSTERVQSANARSLNTRLGKMLRIASDGSIPADNPFFNQATGDNQAIWALGLRNPFTFSVQTGPTRMFINDVGENTWEEINDGIAGSNYGWSICEGFCNPPNANFRDPIFAYANDAQTCAITGGAFYNPTVVQFPVEYLGDYFFSDFCGGWIRKLDPANGNTVTDFATGIASPVDLKVTAEEVSITLRVVQEQSAEFSSLAVVIQLRQRFRLPIQPTVLLLRVSRPCRLRRQQTIMLEWYELSFRSTVICSVLTQRRLTTAVGKCQTR
ncbi:MAG TPA: PQQ-dependent sugar dehydrogenase [Pyrinomonadaceae bacterium]|nr:PQQ-dependent sugar dehydrogenase [Pyrinomonadaceae bacterium]